MVRCGIPLAFALALAGCGGQIAGAGDAPKAPPIHPRSTAEPGSKPAASPADPARPPTSPAADWMPVPGGLRSLTSVEYGKSVRDLLGADLPLPPFERDDILGGYTSVAARILAVSTNDVDRLSDAAAAIARRIAGDAKRRVELTGCQPTGPADATCADKFVRRFGRLAWRRPLTDVEAQRYTRLQISAGGKLEDFWAGVELTLSAFLQSPMFVYRFELGTPGKDARAPRALDPYEIATRLSYVLLNTTPSAALLDAALRGDLATPEGVRSQAEKLLTDARVSAEMGRFFDEWLQLDRLATVERNTSSFTPKLREAMREETLRGLRDLAFDRNGDVREAMAARTTFVNADLAKIYGLPAPVGDASAYNMATLPPGPRAGLFGQASFLTIHSEAVRPSAVLRGKAINESFLCKEVPQPPPNVEAMFPAAPKATMTARDQLKIHRANPACAPCHDRLDPPGLAFENFDHIGRYRERDGMLAIDPSGDLDGKRFADAAEFGAQVGAHPAFAACLVRQLFRYATGVLEDAGQEPRLAALGQRFTEVHHGLRSLVLELVSDPVFRFVGEPR
jgi:hypothetical protein